MITIINMSFKQFEKSFSNFYYDKRFDFFQFNPCSEKPANSK